MELTDTTIPAEGSQVERLSFVMACSKFFGRRSNQTLKEFNDELKSLDAADRIEFKALFKSVGYEVIG